MRGMFWNLLRQYKQSFIHFLFTNYPQLLSDKYYLTIMYRYSLGEEIDWKNPKKFTEKLQWLKLHDRNPLYTTLVDKYAVKQYVSKVLGPEYVIPTLGIYDKFEDIDFDKLPDSFVIKCTHDSGSYVICRNKRDLDAEAAKLKIENCLSKNFYNLFREWPYKNVKPRIIVEPFLCELDQAGGTSALEDYKFFCFNGEVKCFKVDFDRFTNHRANYYKRNGELLMFGEVVCPPQYERKNMLPSGIKTMISFAEKLSSGIRFVRVDFYCKDNQILFGEITFYPNAGFGAFTPCEWNEILGSWLKL